MRCSPLLCRSLTLALLAGLGGLVQAEDTTSTSSESTAPDAPAAQPEKVVVDGFAIEPLGNISSPDNAMVLHPKALLGLGYDSNIFATQTDPTKSAFWDLVAGLDYKWVPSTEDKLILSGEFEGQEYTSQKGRNLNGGQGVVNYRHTANLWDAGVMASAARTDDPFIVTGQEIKHDNYAFEADTSRHWMYETVTLGVTWDRLHYLEGAPGIFSKDDRNYDDTAVNGRVGHEIGDDSEIYARAVVDDRHYDQNTFATPELIPGTTISTTHGYNDSTGVLGVVGWKQKLGVRSGVILEAGAQFREYRDYFAGDSNFNDKTVVYPAVDLRFRWNYEIGSWVGARAFSETEDSVYSNAALMYGLSVDTRFRLKADDKAALFGSLAGYQLHASGGPQTTTQPDAEVRTTGEVTAGAEYILHQGVGLRVKDVLDRSDSKYFNSFTRNVILGEVGFVY